VHRLGAEELDYYRWNIITLHHLQHLPDQLNPGPRSTKREKVDQNQKPNPNVLHKLEEAEEKPLKSNVEAGKGGLQRNRLAVEDANRAKKPQSLVAGGPRRVKNKFSSQFGVDQEGYTVQILSRV